MGRHAAHRPAPDPDGSPGPRAPLQADLFAPEPGSAPAPAAGHRAGSLFDALVAPHRPALRAYVLRLAGGDEAATDAVVKETLDRAAQDPARYPQSEAAVRPWLVLIARTVLRGLGPPAPMSPARRSTTVRGALDGLPEAHREILVELIYRDVSLEDAAERRGVPVETVKSRLYFAMSALRAVLDRHVAGPGVSAAPPLHP